jgi:hypothetical protein
MAALIQSTELANLMIEAHRLLEQFALDLNARPEVAWTITRIIVDVFFI